ncbi:GmrSD restriction endonuclease domain-containing protein [Bifidobacterium cuniculi]|uniref:Excalibur domain containing protein n=1 Tax=Bifidobacterium cuniculi TaxID=1688 RepID=A0A087AZR8_9BIFI|nr:DUF1524 domain-containing protein [Bifidobacterium cuniculi]KFI64268.1 excalibur domain containing protein [Bifidobacterium cuniculi]
MSSSIARRSLAAFASAALLLGLGACSADGLSATSDATQASSSTSASGTTALDVLETLPVKGRAPKTGYSRDQFGAAWADVDHNGCDTRNDVLNRDLTDVTYKDGTHDCVVTSGVLDDPYTGTRIDFTRGQDTSTAVQIDHVVALSNAWQTGAQQLSEEERRQLANDPYNLLAVDGPANQQKSDGDAATWLPSNKSFRCEYVARQIGVKSKYGLWVTQAEHDAMANVLSGCPTQAVPTDDGVQSAGSQTTSQSADNGQDTSGTPSEAADTSVTYANCAAVREAGKAPLHRGEPGYSTALDRDGDGVACE